MAGTTLCYEHVSLGDYRIYHSMWTKFKLNWYFVARFERAHSFGVFIFHESFNPNFNVASLIKSRDRNLDLTIVSHSANASAQFDMSSLRVSFLNAFMILSTLDLSSVRFKCIYLPQFKFHMNFDSFDAELQKWCVILTWNRAQSILTGKYSMDYEAKLFSATRKKWFYK